jgi:hypothetical protein
MTNKDDQAIAAQIGALATAGMVVAVDPDDADLMAAFEDPALSPEEALESRFDDVAEGAA